MRHADTLTTHVLHDLAEIGESLRAARIARDMRKQDWADAIGVGVGTITRLEKGDPTIAISVYLSAFEMFNDMVLPSIKQLVAPENDPQQQIAAQRARSRPRRARGRRQGGIANIPELSGLM